MKILHIYKDYSPVLGGIENHIRTLAELQAGVGHKVSVLVTNPGKQARDEIISGVNLTRLPRIATVASTPLSLSFPGAIRHREPDITHLHFPYPVGEISQWLAGRGRATVITYHSDVVRQRTILQFYAPLLRRILGSADQILPTSQPYLESSPFLRPLAHKCTVVPLSVDLTPFKNAAPLFPPEGLPTLLFLGRHRYYKGIDDLIRVMPELNARLFVGGDGPMRSLWENLSQDLGLTERVRFLGNIPEADLPGLYASADIFVLPANARAEAFGKVLLEAMAAELPCVTTELGTGTSFLVQNGVTGFVVPPGDPDSLCTAIQKLIHATDLRKKLGQAGRARVKEFSPEKLLERIEAVYNKVIGG